MEDLKHRDTVTDFELPAGTFFDAALVHVLTTATLARLWELHPGGRFSLERFRPNVVIKPSDEDAGFTEDAWIGRDIAIGSSVRLRIDAPCGRCVMTTLAQGDLPQDHGILRTAAQYHRANVGVYASVAKHGPIRLGDEVTFA